MFERVYLFYSIHLNSRDTEKVLINQLIRASLNYGASIILQTNSGYEFYITLASKEASLKGNMLMGNFL